MAFAAGRIPGREGRHFGNGHRAVVQAEDQGTGDRLPEIRCATGKATIPAVRRGFQITCVEIGADLAAVGRQNLAGFPDVQVIDASFEKWQRASGRCSAAGPDSAARRR
jgi:16S rRNA A1518/A1519 N6-dimethyltransferase RsmA/KsgA/DIM1 with predicted DNA glycosylase/AP lyase activity